MKRIAILALVGVALTTQAASIKWAVGGKLYGVDGEGSATQAFSSADGWYSDIKDGSFVLVYLGLNQDATTADSITSDMVVATASISSIVTQTGRANAIGNGANLQTTSVGDVVGATYQVFFLNEGTYYDIYTDAGLSTVAKNTAVVSVDAAGAYSANTLYAAGGSTTASYVAVPEPGVAILAILGVGMLLKRRRS